MVLTCFARISKRLHYPTLSLVSKRFLSLLASPELYKTRSESCLYVCIQYKRDPNARWFNLSRKPTLTNDTSKQYVLEPIQVPQSPPAFWSGIVSIGSNIYNIGVPINKAPSSSVSILDCRSHTWLEGPSMHVVRKNPCTSVVDGKIYVTGGSEDCDSSNWMEFFDPKTQTWELVSCPQDICKSLIGKSAVIEEKIYLFGHHGLTYKPKEEKWETTTGRTSLNYVWAWRAYCVIDNKVYHRDIKGIKWYDSKIGRWLHLMGLEGLLKFEHCRCVSLADYGGKLAVLWEEYLPDRQNMMIWCAVIVLERRSAQEMWGEVEWFDAVLTVPRSYTFWSALSATV